MTNKADFTNKSDLTDQKSLTDKRDFADKTDLADKRDLTTKITDLDFVQVYVDLHLLTTTQLLTLQFS